MRQKPINCFAVEFSFLPSDVGFLGIRDSKHISKIARYVVCLYVIGNGFVEASASPNWNGGSELGNGRQVIVVKSESNLSERTVGVFSEVEKNAIKGASESCGSLMPAPDCRREIDAKKEHGEGASGSEQKPGVAGDQADNVHWLIKALVTGMWVGLLMSWFCRLWIYMTQSMSPK